MASQLDLALAQFRGFTHGKGGYSIEELIIGMALKKSEWKKIPDDTKKSILRPSDITDIDNYFNYKFKKTN